MANNEIISQMRRKKADGSYDILQLGPEQCYSAALPTSNNNNLEEQLLLGVDRIVKFWYDDENHVDRRRIEYRRSTDTVGYYILDIYQYKVIDNTADVYVTGDDITFSSNMSVANETMMQDNYDKKIKYNDETLVIQFEGVIERDVLTYVQNDGTVINVSEKVISREVDEDGDTIIITEAITNYLS